MNNVRRKQLAALARKLANLKAEIEGVASDLELVRDEEQEAYDNLPESLQQGEKGEAMQEAINAIEEAASAAEDGNAGEAIEALENIEGVSSSEG